MARAIWKGVLRCGRISVPVKFYSAVQDRTIHLHLLDRRRHQPVEQKMVDPSSGRVVPNKEIGRAYPTDERQLVLLEPGELERLEPTSSREIRLTRFVKPERITHQWYDRPYYLGPDEDREQYFALAEALRLEEKVGVARWVMRKQEYVGALWLEGAYLMMITLRHQDEVIPATSLAAGPARRRGCPADAQGARPADEEQAGPAGAGGRVSPAAEEAGAEEGPRRQGRRRAIRRGD